MRLLPGSLVVFEGLDKTEKSTQVNALSSLAWDSPAPLRTHMPSGLVSLTESIYQLTETAQIHSPLARQLLHPGMSLREPRSEVVVHCCVRLVRRWRDMIPGNRGA